MGRASRARARAHTAIDRRIDPGQLAAGWGGPGGTVLRLARPGEAQAVAALAESTGGPLDEWMHGAIQDGTAGAALRAAARTGPAALRDPVARFAATGDPTPMTELSLALVAEHEGRMVGALYALPPGRVIATCLQQGVPMANAASVALAAIKIKALAVEPEHRASGIATALLSGCTRLYQHLKYVLLYGSFAASSGLGAFYRDRGFEVLKVGESISIDAIVGVPASIGTDPTEQFFVRWLR
jgi:GNAT superfamily N-acetyltransferase